MDPVHAIAVLATIYVSATFAGSITAILINTPGTSAAAATTFDGYPLAQKGEAGRALPASPFCASGYPSKVVAAAADVPGVLIKIAVIDPAKVADT